MDNVNNKTKSQLDSLFANVGTYRNSQDYRNLFNFIKRFPRIAPFNAMLLHIQNPKCTEVMTSSDWYDLKKRKIKANARPLVILVPFGPVDFVFDISDTYEDTPVDNFLNNIFIEAPENQPINSINQYNSEDNNQSFDEQVLDPFFVRGELDTSLIDCVINNLSSYGIAYKKQNFNIFLAGRIEELKACEQKTLIKKYKNIQYKINLTHMISLNRNKTHLTNFATLIHELGHFFCGHLGSVLEEKISDRSFLSKNEVEFEAESISWLICERLKIINPSAEYLSGYLEMNDIIPDISLETVLKVTGIIEKMINSHITPLKEVVLEKKNLN